MKPHISMLAEEHDVTLVANWSGEDFSSFQIDNVQFIHINFARKISIWRDISTLLELYSFFQTARFDVVHSLMPKTGLIAMLAAFFARVPHRIHTFTGQVWVNRKGLARWGLKTLDKLIVKCATGLLADSFSQRQFLIDQRIVEKNKVDVLGSGSVCGVDVNRFKPNAAIRRKLRSNFGIPEDAIVYLFLGRVNKDKGILDLAHAFADLTHELQNIHLMIVGPEEDGMDIALQSILEKCTKQYHRVGYTDKPEDYMACADVFCLPSYREGFGSVVIEAAAVGVPAVASEIYGLVDALENGETGIFHQPKDIESIKRALRILTLDSKLRKCMSTKAVNRAYAYFRKDIVVDAMRTYYKNILN